MTDEEKAIRDRDELIEAIKLFTPKQLEEYIELEEQGKIIKARTSYIDYLRYVYSDIWKDGKHVKFIANKIEKLMNNELFDEKGNVARCLMLSMPPQHGKSMTVTNTLPSFFVGKDPNKRVAIIAYGEDLAIEFGRENLTKIAQFGQKVFGVELNPNSKAVGDFRIQGKRGRIFSRGISAGITGNPADLIIVDDPYKNDEEAMNPEHRKKVYKEFLKSIISRMSANAKIIVIHTRWSTDDLIGKLARDKKVRNVYFNIPCEAEENDILGREAGDSLFPEDGKDKEWLKEYKEIYSDEEGLSAWYSMYQGKPLTEGGNIIQKDWIKPYTKEELPPLGKIIISVDATFKDKLTSDFVSIGAWGKAGNKYYLLDEIHKRLNFPDTMMAIRRMKNEYPKTSNIFIEDKANGSAIIQMLRKELDGITPVEPKGGKVSRLNSVSHLFQSGQVYLPSDKPFYTEFVEELVTFPNSSHDDRCDMTSQALQKLLEFRAYIPTDQERELEERRKYKYNKKVKILGGATERATGNYIKFKP